MTSDFDQITDEAVNALSQRNGRVARWPKLPGHDADLATIRGYLTKAACLPDGWSIDLADRHGQYGTDPVTITINTPGQAPNVHVRFDQQRDVSKPSALRGAFVEATNGASRMKYPKPVEASDFYVMVCALAHVSSTGTIADETRCWVDEYLEAAHVIVGSSLGDKTQRYDTLVMLQGRAAFNRVQASRYVRNDLPPEERWIALSDTATSELWIRASELATYLRHVHGLPSIAQHTLDARIRELDGDRVRLEERNSHGRHICLVFYRFPSVQAFPSVTRMQHIPGNATRARTP